MSSVEKFHLLVGAWPGVSAHPHRFEAREFRYRGIELGHLHASGVLDLPFSRPLRDELVARKLAEPHRWVPDSGWVTYRISGDKDLKAAVWLLRLSYVCQLLKFSPNPGEVFSRERERLALDATLADLVQTGQGSREAVKAG